MLLHKAVAVDHNIVDTIGNRLLVVLLWVVVHHNIVHSRLAVDLEQRHYFLPQLCYLWNRRYHRLMMEVEELPQSVRDPVVGSCIDSQDIVDSLHTHNF